jgi:hypothetical protein
VQALMTIWLETPADQVIDHRRNVMTTPSVQTTA